MTQVLQTKTLLNTDFRDNHDDYKDANCRCDKDQDSPYIRKISLDEIIALLYRESQLRKSGPQKVKWWVKVLLLYHMLIFIQYFCFLFDISSVICWTQAKQERDEMGKTAIEEEASSKTTKSDITSHKCNQCSFSSVWEKNL